nr:uncharacterized protein LOC111990031 isoform X3 [Quercus suber]
MLLFLLVLNLEAVRSSQMEPPTATSSSLVKPVRIRVVIVEEPGWKMMEQHRWICKLGKLIQPKVDTDGKKVANKPPYLNLSNGEQKLTETDLDMPFHDRGQLAILGQRDDDGSAPTMCLSHSKEGLLQEIEKPDWMEFEEGGSTLYRFYRLCGWPLASVGS